MLCASQCSSVDCGPLLLFLVLCMVRKAELPPDRKRMLRLLQVEKHGGFALTDFTTALPPARSVTVAEILNICELGFIICNIRVLVVPVLELL